MTKNDFDKTAGIAFLDLTDGGTEPAVPKVERALLTIIFADGEDPLTWDITHLESFINILDDLEQDGKAIADPFTICGQG